MRAMDVMTTEVISVGRTHRCTRSRRSFPSVGSAECPSSMPTIGWSASSARVTCCIASKPGPSGGPCAGAHGGPRGSRPIASWPATYVKSHARTVKDVMTRDVVSVSDTTEFADIATLLETKRIKRVPVVRDGKSA